MFQSTIDAWREWNRLEALGLILTLQSGLQHLSGFATQLTYTLTLTKFAEKATALAACFFCLWILLCRNVVSFIAQIALGTA
jgi:hypothetical protein